MGVFKKYSPAIAADALRLCDVTDTSAESGYRRQVPLWHDITGEEWKQLIGTIYRANNAGSSYYECAYNLTTYWGALTPVATDDILEEFDVQDFSINPVGITSHSQSATISDVAIDRIYSIRVTNNTTENTYIQNTDPVWRDRREYYSRSGEEGSYIYTRVYTEPSDFGTTYRNYYISQNGNLVIKCIKFKKNMYVVAKDLGGSYWYNKKETKPALYCAYFLDESEWITIPPGESRNLIIDFSAIVA